LEREKERGTKELSKGEGRMNRSEKFDSKEKKNRGCDYQPEREEKT